MVGKSTQVHTPDIKQNMYDCSHQVTVGKTNVNILVIDFFCNFSIFSFDLISYVC